jgi:hypothetical protein
MKPASNACLPCDKDVRLDQEPAQGHGPRCSTTNKLGNVILSRGRADVKTSAACKWRPFLFGKCRASRAWKMRLWMRCRVVASPCPSCTPRASESWCHSNTHLVRNLEIERGFAFWLGAHRQSTEPLASFVGKRSSDTVCRDSRPASLKDTQQDRSNFLPRICIGLDKKGK